MKRVLQAAAIAVVVLLLSLLGWQVVNQANGRSIASASKEGRTPMAPDFELPLVNGPGKLRLSSLRGKVVVLNFWQSTCAPCLREAPVFRAAWSQYRFRSDVVFLGVDFWDLKSDASRFMAKHQLPYRSVYDGPGSTLGHYGVFGAPETFFINKRGELVGAHILGPATAEELASNIRLALSS